MSMHEGEIQERLDYLQELRRGLGHQPEVTGLLRLLCAPDARTRSDALDKLLLQKDSWLKVAIYYAEAHAERNLGEGNEDWLRWSGRDGKAGERARQTLEQRFKATCQNDPLELGADPAKDIFNYLARAAQRQILSLRPKRVKHYVGTMRRAVSGPCRRAINSMRQGSTIGAWLEQTDAWQSLDPQQRHAALQLLDVSVFDAQPPFTGQVPDLTQLTGVANLANLPMRALEEIAGAAISAEARGGSQSPPGWIRAVIGRFPDTTRKEFMAALTELFDLLDAFSDDVPAVLIARRVATRLNVDEAMVKALITAAQTEFVRHRHEVSSTDDESSDGSVAQADDEAFDTVHVGEIVQEAQELEREIRDTGHQLAERLRTLADQARPIERRLQAGLRYRAWRFEQAAPLPTPPKGMHNTEVRIDLFYQWALDYAAEHPGAWTPGSRQDTGMNKACESADRAMIADPSARQLKRRREDLLDARRTLIARRTAPGDDGESGHSATTRESGEDHA